MEGMLGVVCTFVCTRVWKAIDLPVANYFSEKVARMPSNDYESRTYVDPSGAGEGVELAVERLGKCAG